MKVVFNKLNEAPTSKVNNQKAKPDKYASARNWVKAQQVKDERRANKSPEVIRLKKIRHKILTKKHTKNGSRAF